MSRTRPARTLPPLATVLPNFTGLPANTTQALGLRAALRPLTEQLREKEPVLFYPMREVSEFFHVPLPTVAQVYRELEAEGRITRLRGAHTLLLPKRHQPHTPVRGVVGLPLWEAGFCELLHWRIFFRELETQLRHHHYVADAIFFRQESEADLFEQLVGHQLDYVVWLRPLPRHKHVLERLADGGTPSVVLPEPEFKLPFPTWYTVWDTALRRALAAWAQAGITSVTVVQPPQRLATVLPPALARHRFAVRSLPGTCFAFRRWVERLPADPRAGVILADDQLAEQFIGRYPDSFAKLARRRRVLLKTTIPADPEWVRGCPIDYIEFNWPKIGTAIAEAIANGSLLRQREPVICPAKLHLRADAARFAQGETPRGDS